jgi:hypothetical protein
MVTSNYQTLNLIIKKEIILLENKILTIMWKMRIEWGGIFRIKENEPYNHLLFF